MTDVAAPRPYGVLGRVLGHSYTPTIYKELAGLEYVRFEREPEDLQAFMTGDEWEGTNVTIPYKRAVMEYLDELSPLAERMGNVNTITRLPDGRLRGAKRMISRFGQKHSSLAKAASTTSSRQRVHRNSVSDNRSILSICPKLGQLSFKKASLLVELCKSSFIRQGRGQVESFITTIFYLFVYSHTFMKKARKLLLYYPMRGSGKPASE